MLVKKAKAEEKITILTNKVVSKITGDTTVKEIEITDTVYGSKEMLECSGVFIAIGREPSSAVVPPEIERDNDGFITADKNMKTNLDGVYVAGDLRNTPLRQVVTAVADGAVAAVSAINYIN